MRRALALFAALLVAGCARARDEGIPSPERVPLPDPAEVERVIFLLGDGGELPAGTNPVLARLQRDVEWWSERLAGDSTVLVVNLGDIVYPLGVHPPGHEQFDRDTAVLMDQVRLVGGPAARGAGARQYFVAGNHDWGLRMDWEGASRLQTLEQVLSGARSAGIADVHLAPRAGTGGPHVLDWGDGFRIILLDTAWWLLRADVPEKNEILAQIEEAMTTAGPRRVMLAAHHPFKSAGPHGGDVPFWSTLGLQYILTRSGAILQDLSSTPYRRLEQGLRGIFSRTGPPLIFAGGHEHSVQVIHGVEPTDPKYILVSGSASKISGVGEEEGLVFARSAMGYMRLILERDGDLSVFVEAVPEGEPHCPGAEPERTTCMEEGIASVQTLHSQRLR